MDIELITEISSAELERLPFVSVLPWDGERLLCYGRLLRVTGGLVMVEHQKRIMVFGTGNTRLVFEKPLTVV